MAENIANPIIVEPPTTPATAGVIFLHGLGASGEELASLVSLFKLPADHGIRFVCPQAPERPVTANGGYVMPAWYDIYGFNYGSKEDAAGLAASAELMNEYILMQKEQGINLDRITVAGFSQGGALALYTGLHASQPLAGIIALSTYLPVRTQLVAAATSVSRQSPIFMGHGHHDDVIPYTWGREAYDCLTELNYKVEWHGYNTTHSITPNEFFDMGQWLLDIYNGVGLSA